MPMYKKVFVVLLMVLLTVLSLESSSAVFADMRVRTLDLKDISITGSILDPLKNILVIENAYSLNPVVSIKPTKLTLPNGRAVKVKGVKSDNELKVDLGSIEPANLIPSGEYYVTALNGNRKVGAIFYYNAPTVIIGKIIVPVGKKGAAKSRIIREQLANQNLLNDKIPDAIVGLFDENHQPIENVRPILASGIKENGNNVYQFITEIPPGIEVSHAVIKAQVEAPTVTGVNKKFNLSALVFPEDTDPVNMLISNIVVNVASTTATNVVTATLTKIVGVTNSPDIKLKKTYLSALKVASLGKDLTSTTQTVSLTSSQDTIVDHERTLQQSINLVNNTALTIDQALQQSEAAYEVNSTDLYKEIVNDLNQINGLGNDISNIAANIAWKAPGIINKAPEYLTDENKVDSTSINTYAAGYFDQNKLNQSDPQPSLIIQAQAYTQANVIPGSLKLPDNPQDIITALQNGNVPKTEFNPVSIDKLNQFQDLANQGLVPNLSTGQFNTIPIPPGVNANIDQIKVQAQTDLSNKTGVNFQAAPGSFPKGDPGSFQFNAFPGVFMPPDLVSKATLAAPSLANNIQYPSGLIPPQLSRNSMVTIGFIPSTIIDNFSSSDNLKIFVGNGKSQDVQGSVFVLNTSNQEQTPAQPNTNIAVFDPAKDIDLLINSLQNLDSKNIDQVFGNSAVVLAGALSVQEQPLAIPKEISNLASNSVKLGNVEFDDLPPVSLNDILGTAINGFTTSTPTSGDITNSNNQTPTENVDLTGIFTNNSIKDPFLPATSDSSPTGGDSSTPASGDSSVPASGDSSTPASGDSSTPASGDSSAPASPPAQ